MSENLRKYGMWVAIYVFGVVMGRASLFSSPDKHFPPQYGQASGLPTNCSAYIEASITGFRARRYSAEETMAGLERNCGANGQLWKD